MYSLYTNLNDARTLVNGILCGTRDSGNAELGAIEARGGLAGVDTLYSNLNDATGLESGF